MASEVVPAFAARWRQGSNAWITSFPLHAVAAWFLCHSVHWLQCPRDWLHVTCEESHYQTDLRGLVSEGKCFGKWMCGAYKVRVNKIRVLMSRFVVEFRSWWHLVVEGWSEGWWTIFPVLEVDLRVPCVHRPFCQRTMNDLQQIASFLVSLEMCSTVVTDDIFLTDVFTKLVQVGLYKVSSCPESQIWHETSAVFFCLIKNSLWRLKLS